MHLEKDLVPNIKLKYELLTFFTPTPAPFFLQKYQLKATGSQFSDIVFWMVGMIKTQLLS